MKFDEFKIPEKTMEALTQLTIEATNTFNKMREATKNLVTATNDISPWLLKNMKTICALGCRNKRVIHLGLYAKKERTRSKNISRALRIVKKQANIYKSGGDRK